jgi:hypothetical protein
MSDLNQEREYQVGVFEARKRIIKLLTEQEYQAGVGDERARILAELEALIARMAAMETGYGPKSGNMAIRIKTLEYAITLIKGENE